MKKKKKSANRTEEALRLRVAFQGELGAYSEMAAHEFFQQLVETSPQTSFELVFDAVEQGQCTHGIVPIENSLTGSIHQNYDLLLKRKLYIVGEIKLRVVHNLIAFPGVELREIKRIFSHPQALSQCQIFLQKIDWAEKVAFYDTAGAVRYIKDNKLYDSGAVASSQAAVDYDMSIVEDGIENDHKNFTRFLIVARSPKENTSDAKTSIVISLRNIPGALYNSLGVFATRDIDLLKIESRPIHGRPWEYMFYLDFDGATTEERCREAIEELKEKAESLRILGSYDKGKEIDGNVYKRRIEIRTDVK